MLQQQAVADWGTFELPRHAPSRILVARPDSLATLWTVERASSTDSISGQQAQDSSVRVRSVRLRSLQKGRLRRWLRSEKIRHLSNLQKAQLEQLGQPGEPDAQVIAAVTGFVDGANTHKFYARRGSARGREASACIE